MARFQEGDPVVYNGNVYWIVGGINTVEGYKRELSMVPPTLRVLETELRECPAAYEEAAIDALRGGPTGPG